VSRRADNDVMGKEHIFHCQETNCSTNPQPDTYLLLNVLVYMCRTYFIMAQSLNVYPLEHFSFQARSFLALNALLASILIKCRLKNKLIAE
jgi:hypothetical protein